MLYSKLVFKKLCERKEKCYTAGNDTKEDGETKLLLIFIGNSSIFGTTINVKLKVLLNLKTILSDLFLKQVFLSTVKTQVEHCVCIIYCIYVIYSQFIALASAAFVWSERIFEVLS